MEHQRLEEFARQLERRNAYLEERERDLAERNEELLAQKEELSAAVDAFVSKSESLEVTVSQLRRRNYELDQVLYRASHDLRSPIASIEGVLTMLKETNTSADAQQLYHLLTQNILRMNDLLNTLGTLAHASFDHINIGRINLSDAVRMAIEQISYLTNHKYCSFRLTMQEDLCFATDPFLFSILIKSLLSNAVIFRDAGKPGVVEVDARLNDRVMVLTVLDDGEGILPEARDSVFEMFYRGSEKSIGSGLGLYIAKTLVDRFDGSIRFESVQGRTLFEVVLPTREAIRHS